MIHSLKCLPKFFQDVVDQKKPFEIRKNDRGFESGDDVILNEWMDGVYTGRYCCLVIKNVFDLSPVFPGYVGFTFKFLGFFEVLKDGNSPI